MSDMDQMRQHQRLARSGTLAHEGGGDTVEELKSHRGRSNGDSGNKMLHDHERAKGKSIRWSNHHLPAEAAPDHGKCS